MPEFPGTLKPPRLASAPGTPVGGQMYYDTATVQLKWWNGTTWVVATGTGALPADSVVVAATRIIANKLLAGDTQPAWRVMGDGRMDWGPGGTTAPDVSLYRSTGAGYGTTLTTDNPFYSNVTGSNWAFIAMKLGAGGIPLTFGQSGDTQPRFYMDSSGSLSWGPGGTTAADTILYRAFANNLTTKGGFSFYHTSVIGALTTALTSDTNYRFYIDTNGAMNWGPGTATQDAQLYRSSAGVLTMVALLTIGRTATTDVAFQAGTLSNLYYYMRADGAMNWGSGSAWDTNLYRLGSAQLKSDSHLFSAGDLVAEHTAATQMIVGNLNNWLGGGVRAGISFTNDTLLYRNAASQLRTDGSLIVGTNIFANYGTANQVNVGWAAGVAAGIEFGSGGDTRIYRSAANTLKTDGDLYLRSVAANISVTVGANVFAAAVSGEAQWRFFLQNDGKMQWGGGAVALDTNLYRSAAGVLKTDGILNAVGGLQVNGSAVGVVKLYDNTLAATTASIDITSISQTYSRIRLMVISRADVAEPLLIVRFNGDSAGNYSGNYMVTGSGNPTGGEFLSQTHAGGGWAFVGSSTHPAGTFSVVTFEIPAYAMTTNLKFCTWMWNRFTGMGTASGQMRLATTFWNTTAALNRITLSVNGGNFVSGTRVVLLGDP